MNNTAAMLSAKYGAHKAEITELPPRFLLDTAASMRWNMPDTETYEGQAMLYTRLSWIYSAVNATAERCALQDFNVLQRRGEEKDDIPNHPFELLLERPNPLNSQFELIRDTISYGSINNNAYWWLNRTSPEMEPKEIWMLPPHRILPVPDGKMYLKGYIYNPGSGYESQMLPTWQIAHFKGFNPLNEFVGLSGLEPFGLDATTDIESQKWSNAYFGKNNARLPGILAFRDQINNPLAWERIKNDVQQAAEMRNLLLLRGVGDKVDWLKAAATQEEMQLIAQRMFFKEEAYAVFAPGYLSMTSENATEANSKAGRQTWIDVSVWTKLVAMAQKVTLDILPAYGDNLIGEFEDPRQTDRALELQEEDAYSRVHTIDEIRQEKYNDDPIGDDRGNLLPAEVGKGKTPDEDSAARTPPQLLPFTGQQGQDEPEADDIDNPESGEDEEEAAETKADLDRWRRKALKAFKASGSAAVTFESDTITPELHASIWAQLSACKSASDVRDVFDRAIAQGEQTSDLAEQVKALTELVKDNLWSAYP